MKLVVMRKGKNGWAPERDKGAKKLIARLQKQEDDAKAERRRLLANGLSRALLHLTDDEMALIEPVVYTAIGRSVVQR